MPGGFAPADWPDLPLRLQTAGRFGKLELLERIERFLPGTVETFLKLGYRGFQVVPAGHSGTGESRIGEVIDIANPRSLLLDLDLLIEVVGHTAEVGDHHFEVTDLLPFFIVIKSLILNGTSCLDHASRRPLLQLLVSKQFRFKPLILSKASPLCNMIAVYEFLAKSEFGLVRELRQSRQIIDSPLGFFEFVANA